PSDASIWLISLIALGGVVGALSLPAISDRMKDRRRMIVVSNSLVAMASMIAVMKSSSLIAASALIFGLAYGAIWPLYGSCASEYFGEENAGKVVGFWTFFLGLGSILSPAISGAVADIYGTLTATLMLNTAIALISIIPLIFIKVKA
ncbi:MAG: MFS transporter, partial [Candidatus Nezhaarchaeales archaeon]